MIPPIVFHPAYEATLPDGHRFPMRKYGRLAEVVAERGLAPLGFIQPEPASAALLAHAHARSYIDAVLAHDVPRAVERAIGLPVDEAVVRRSRASVGGTLLAARLALAEGLAGSTAGGSHHARREQGAGFCLFNDVAVAARALQHEGAIARALVVDLDVHQGDGTADCLAYAPDLFTLSVHCERNYPSQKIPGDLDIGLPDGMEDAAYLDVLAARLPPLLDALRPDLVFYNAGVDPHRDDRLGRLALSDDGLYARDRYVVGQARARRIPLVAVIGGGYTHDVDALAARHALVFEALAAVAET
ncbi:histone deacetylase [Methylobacterium gregans]|uniref:Acetoin utilization protein AcuC n=1 Tax=Methylobacterium gregans TaxID=374424 RepID=A0AA37HWS6_9HYPH|nr:histone deacetylase [Methylobacterium gregans]MDQ0524023.1 acetoin utilization deacetylase AcuC-like enzyme [Methylobacterium gregans]GJD81778.1 Acetoin utilization protein AcuC [Methylobacterium gregans]GLS56935.1 histone deacetylase [Methylobacterium gregans]